MTIDEMIYFAYVEDWANRQMPPFWVLALSHIMSRAIEFVGIYNQGKVFMARVKLSKDGSSIDFVQSDTLPASMKKFRQSPEIEGFYRFVFENHLQKEASEILEVIYQRRQEQKPKKKKK